MNKIMEITTDKEDPGVPSDLTKDLGDDTFVFEYVGNKLDDKKETQDNLMKWGLKDNLQTATFRYNWKFNEINPEPFFVDFFNSAAVQKHLTNIQEQTEKCSKVIYHKLRTSKVSMDLFERLEEHGIVKSHNKLIQGMLEEEYHGIRVQDKLGECILNEESEEYSVYSSDDRKEFLFRILQALYLGGGMCQFEESINPYLETTKIVYKNLVNAKKDTKTNNIFVESVVFEIAKIDNKALFKNTDNPQNFFYLIVSPALRQVTILSHYYKNYW